MAVFVVFLTLAIIIAALFTWLVRYCATYYGLAHGPSSSRHLHTSPIPRLGGVAIFATFLALYGIFRFGGTHGWTAQALNNDVFRVLLPGTGLFLVGLVDDLWGLTARIKLLAQVIGGCSLFYSGLHFACFNWAGAAPWVNSAICLLTTVFWVVLVCNAINLIDGLDGLASGAALFSMVTVFTVALVEGRTGVAVAALVLGGSMLGFLVFNFNPASIFLGDSGSQFVGFMLAGFVLAEAQKQQTVLDSIAIPLISLALPLTDTALSVLRRFLSGHSLFGADREHIHHKLLELGLTQRQVVLILYGVSASCAVLSLFLLQPSDLMLVPVAGIVLLVIFFGVRKLGYHELAEFQRVWKRAMQQREVFVRNISVRKAATELRKLHNFDRVVQVLEDCLIRDFDGFELVLDADVFANQTLPWAGPIQRTWRNGYEERIVFALELSTPQRGLIGKLSCHRQMGSGWLIDTDLLAGDLQAGLGIAIENCVSHASPALFKVRVVKAWTNAGHPETQFQVFQDPAFQLDEQLASTAGGDD